MFLLVSLMVAKGVTVFLQRWLLALMRARFEVAMKNRLYGAIIEADWPFFVAQRTGGVANLMIVEARRTGTAFEIFIMGFGALLNILVYLTIALFVSWPITLFAAAGGLLLSGGFRALVSAGRRVGTAMSQANDQLAAEITDTMGGAKVVKSAAMERLARNRLDVLVRRLAHIDVRLGILKGVLESTYEPAFATFMVLMIFVASQVVDVSNSALMLFALLSFRMVQRGQALQGLIQGLGQATPGFDRLLEVEGEAIAHRERTSGDEFGGLKDGIELRHVSYSYGRGEQVLEDVSLTLPARAVTAFVGFSGGGKTTLLDLLSGLLQPTDGSILVDGTPLDAYTLSSWRSRIGYVTQETLLFDDTIAANISWGLVDVSEEDIREAAQVAGIHEAIEAMPNGYQTMVGERGMELSGGQRQRIALARALARKPDLLLLDEATSELDADSEQHIQTAVQELKRHVTVVTVAHRLSSIVGAERIYVFDKGRLVEQGSATELLERRGVFYGLYQQLEG
jgi:subfamily B ATP-binding cassette protein MsbA